MLGDRAGSPGPLAKGAAWLMIFDLELRPGWDGLSASIGDGFGPRDAQEPNQASVR
jgi:hypothetical protein